MGHIALSAMGRVLKHFVGALLIAWQRAFRAGAIAGLLAILVVEIASVIITHQFPPAVITHVVAGALAIALGFGVAATVVADEIIAGIIELIRMLLGEAEAGARQAARIAEREVGDVRGVALRLTGLDTLMRRFAPREAPDPDLAPDAPRQPVRSRHPNGISTAALLAALAAPEVAHLARRHAQDASATAPATLSSTTIGPLASTVAIANPPAPIPTRDLVASTPAPLEPLAAPTASAAASATANTPTLDSFPMPAASSPTLVGTIPAYELPQDSFPTEPLAAPSLEPASNYGQPAQATTPLGPLPVRGEGKGREDPSDPSDDARDAISLTPTVPAIAAGAAYGQSAPATIPLASAPAPVVAAPASGALAEPAEWHTEEASPAEEIAWHDPAQAGLELEHEEGGAGIQPVDAFGALPPSAGVGSAARDVPPPIANTRPLFEPFRRSAPDTRPLMPRGSIWDHITNVVAGRQVEAYPPTEDTAQDGTTEEESPAGS